MTCRNIIHGNLALDLNAMQTNRKNTANGHKMLTYRS